MEENYDFSGYATRNGVLCADGRTICKDAFKEDDGKRVPLCWMHQHFDPEAVLGHALLVNRDDGVYAYGKFNDTPDGEHARKLVKNGDITSLSIYANHLKQDSRKNVMHGSIKEVSLVLAGANDGAYIDNVMISHGDEWIESEDEVEFSIGNQNFELDPVFVLEHADNDETEKDDEMAEEKTVKDVVETMNEEQKAALITLVNEALNAGDDDDEDEDVDDEEEIDDEVEHGDYEGETFNMKQNVFDNTMYDDGVTLSHDDMEEIFREGKRLGSLKEAVEEFSLQHADYGITDIDTLFPDARTLTNTPEFIKRETEWVADFYGRTKKTPFSRIKSVFADITAEEARAKGYTKGKLKKEEVFALLKRTTLPTTVYKKQKLDRDDVIDITDFDVLAWIKTEMRIMFEEEVARAGLLGDGRLASSDDKINEQCIRPIVSDADLYAVKVPVGANVTDYAEVIKTIIRARKNYKGSGNPTFYTTEDVLTEMLLLEDKMGRPLYESVDKLATKLRVGKIVTVEAMEEEAYKNIMGVIVNPVDYTYGADNGGKTAFFEDFDIDYNQQKYLYEGRCSGALVKPFSALVLQKKDATSSDQTTEE